MYSSKKQLMIRKGIALLDRATWPVPVCIFVAIAILTTSIGINQALTTWYQEGFCFKKKKNLISLQVAAPCIPQCSPADDNVLNSFEALGENSEKFELQLPFNMTISAEQLLTL